MNLLPLHSQTDTQTYTKTNFNGTLELTPLGATQFAKLFLDCAQKEYPNKLNQVLDNPQQLLAPKQLHPSFYGCFDWHSAVHGHWMMIKILKKFPNIPIQNQIRQVLNSHLTKDLIKQELAYFNQANKNWERTYGWAWFLKLTTELYEWNDNDGKRWLKVIQPLTNAIVERYENFLPQQIYPIRAGTHTNTAFGLNLAWEFAKKSNAIEFQSLIEKTAKRFFINDHTCPSDWEPNGDDFLSNCLEEANLMSRILPEKEFRNWFKYFLPKDKLFSLFKPAVVNDRSDPKTAHLDGLNLSKAWNMYQISQKNIANRTKELLKTSATQHIKNTLPYITSKHYEGTHWLATFAVYALSIQDTIQHYTDKNAPEFKP